MESYAYYNGDFGKKEDISIPLSDRSIYFGDAIYDAAIGSYDRILWEDEHIDRFLLGAKKIGIVHSFTHKYLSEILREIAVKSMIKNYLIYFQISRGMPKRIHSSKGASVNLLVTVDPIEIRPDLPPMSLITFEDKRYEYCDIKTVNLLPSVLAATKADFSGCDEAVFVRRGFVTECSKSNISILKQGRVYTHPENNNILAGITRHHLRLACKLEGIDFIEEKFTVKDMILADEILVTGTGKLCRTAGSVNGITVGGKSKEISTKLQNHLFKEYSDLCR